MSVLLAAPAACSVRSLPAVFSLVRLDAGVCMPPLLSTIRICVNSHSIPNEFDNQKLDSTRQLKRACLNRKAESQPSARTARKCSHSKTSRSKQR